MKQEPKVSTYLLYKFHKLYNGFIFFNYYENIWFCFFLFFTSIAVMLIKNVIELQTNPEYNSILIASFSDLYIVIPVIVITWFSRDMFTHLTKDYMIKYIDNTTYKTDQDRKDRAETWCKFVMDFVFYSLTSIITYYVVKDSKFLPPYLLGSGDAMLAHPNFPEYEPVPYLKQVYCFQMGYHLYAFLFQIKRKRKDSKFYEFLLHHCMAFFLIFFSYSINLINSGIMVLLTHDISDAVLVLGRGYGDFTNKNKKVVNIIYVIAFGSWIYTRLYAFPRSFIIPEILTFYETQPKYQYLMSPIRAYIISMTCMLFLMHIYWSIFMMKALFYCSVKNKVKVEYDLKDLKGNKKEKSLKTANN